MMAQTQSRMVWNWPGAHACRQCDWPTSNISLCEACSDMLRAIMERDYWKARQSEWLREQDRKVQVIRGDL